MKVIKQYLSSFIMLAVIGTLYFFRQDIALQAMKSSFASIKTMLGILPPLLIIIHAIDSLVSKEIILKHMGEDAGMRGYFWALILGTFAAGPLYAAFPIAAILSRKGAHLSYIIFFLGIWTTTKLPIFLLELNLFGIRFTTLHAVTGIISFYLLSVIMEKYLLKDKKEEIAQRLDKFLNEGE